MNIIIWILLGAAAGWLAGNFTKGGGFGFFMNVILGICGSIVGGFCFGLLGLSSSNLIGSLITATVGAVIILWLANKLRT